MVNWTNEGTIDPRKYKCYHCDTPMASNKGYYNNKQTALKIYICSYCNKPTYFHGDLQIPSALLGNRVENVPLEIDSLYNEARACTGSNAFTAAVLACRKILMHIAVEKGDKKGKSFLEYVEYLSDKGYVPPDGKHWVDHIRQKGNEANHEIVLMKPEDAQDLITFIEMLLKFIYEFPQKIKSKTVEGQ